MIGKEELLKSLLWYAHETIVYMLNKVQSKSVVVTPYGIRTNKDPYFSHLNIWDYPA